jgi:hypothetical protein
VAGLRGADVVPAITAALHAMQAQLQAALKVPLVSSSLLQLPELLARDGRVGVLTISARHLGEEHLLAAGVPSDRLRDVLVQASIPSASSRRCCWGIAAVCAADQGGNGARGSQLVRCGGAVRAGQEFVVPGLTRDP